MRVSTKTVYERVRKSRVLSKDEERSLDGGATRQITLKAAKVFGVVQTREIWQEYYDGIFADNGVPEGMSFAVSSDAKKHANQGHQLVGWHQDGWVRFTDWQYEDIGEDSTQRMIGDKQKRYIKFVYWFESLKKWK